MILRRLKVEMIRRLAYINSQWIENTVTTQQPIGEFKKERNVCSVGNFNEENLSLESRITVPVVPRNVPDWVYFLDFDFLADGLIVHSKGYSYLPPMALSKVRQVDAIPRFYRDPQSPERAFRTRIITTTTASGADGKVRYQGIWVMAQVHSVREEDAPDTADSSVFEFGIYLDSTCLATPEEMALVNSFPKNANNGPNPSPSIHISSEESKGRTRADEMNWGPLMTIIDYGSWKLYVDARWKRAVIRLGYTRLESKLNYISWDQWFTLKVRTSLVIKNRVYIDDIPEQVSNDVSLPSARRFQQSSNGMIASLDPSSITIDEFGTRYMMRPAHKAIDTLYEQLPISHAGDEGMETYFRSSNSRRKSYLQEVACGLDPFPR